MWLLRIVEATSTVLGVAGLASFPSDVKWWRDVVETLGPENLKWVLMALPVIVGLWLWRHDIPWLARG